MIANLFESILQELGKTDVIPIQNLHPDGNNSCLIRLKGGLEIQIELDKSGTMLVIGCDLGSPAAGRFRENIFREALKANGLPSPRWGEFAYSQKTDHLVLFHKMHTRDLTGEKVADFLSHFLEKAFLWRDALEHNDVPVVSGTQTSRPLGMFGLR
jgi:hypothetical protein